MVRILTKDFGKITTRAISARKHGSKLAGHLEPFIHSDFFIAGSKTIDIVAGSNAITPHLRLRSSLEHAAMAGYFAEVVDRATQEHEVDRELYEHVREFYTWLEEHDAHVFTMYAAVLQLFALLGYRAELYACHQCKQSVTENGTVFHFELWNVQCEDCKSHDQTLSLSAQVIKVLRFLNEHHFSEATKLHLTHEEWKEAHAAIRSMLRYHFDRELNSEPVLLALLRR